MLLMSKALTLHLYFELQRATDRHRSDVNTARIPSTLQFNTVGHFKVSTLKFL